MPNVVIVNQNLTNGYSEDYDDDEDQEYVYDTDRKAIKIVKDLLETKQKQPINHDS